MYYQLNTNTSLRAMLFSRAVQSLRRSIYAVSTKLPKVQNTITPGVVRVFSLSASNAQCVFP